MPTNLYNLELLLDLKGGRALPGTTAAVYAGAQRVFRCRVVLRNHPVRSRRATRDPCALTLRV